MAQFVLTGGLSVVDKPTKDYFIEIGLGHDEPLSEVEDDEDTDDDTASFQLIVRGIRTIVISIIRSPQATTV